MDEFIETTATEEYRYLRRVVQVSFRQAPVHADISEFQSFLLQLENQWSGKKLCEAFSHLRFIF